MPNGDCVIGAECRADIKSIRERMDELNADNQRQWQAMDKLRELLNRPPAWCAWAMTGLGSVAGGAVGALITILLQSKGGA